MGFFYANFSSYLLYPLPSTTDYNGDFPRKPWFYPCKIFTVKEEIANKSFFFMFSFETREVYKKALSANKQVYRFLKINKTIPIYYKSQFGRASLSIMLNIAEGSAKFGNKDKRKFYIIARGFVFECAALINFLWEEGEIVEELKNELSGLYDEISRILYRMIKTFELKINSEKKK